MRHLPTAASVALIALALTGCSDDRQRASQTSSQVEQRTDAEKTLYALGAAIGSNLVTFDLTEEELEHVQRGLADSALKKDVGDIHAQFPQIQALQQERMAAAAEAEKKASEEYLAKAAAEPDAQQLPSGVVYKEVRAGTGPSPNANDIVKVHYHGTLRDGEVFDSSIERNEPATFPLNGVIPCWTEAVQKMKVGGKSRLVCPSATAYGEVGSPPQIMPNAALIFDVELLGVEKQEG